MKRLLIGFIAMALVLVFVMPAAAEVKMGAMVYTDMGYIMRSKDNTGSGSSDYNAFVDLARHSRLYGRWSEENMGAYMEIGMGSGGPSASSSSNSSLLNFRKLYGFYKFGNFQLTAGHTEALGASRYNPSQLMGFNEYNHIILAGFGNLYQRIAQVDIEYRAGIWYFGFGVNTPSTFGLEGNEYSPFWKLSGVAGLRTKMIDLTLDGMLSITNSKDEPASADDSATGWVATFHADFNFNIVKVRVHPFYGQNVGNLGLEGFSSSAVVDANGQIQNTDSWGGYVDVTIGGDPFLVHVMGGYTKDDNDQYVNNNSRWAVAVRGAWKVASNFTLSPEVGYYDYGDNAFTNADQGNQWLAGVQFQFVF